MVDTWENLEDIVGMLESEGLLVKKGSTYFCPFCEDPATSKSPSFSISKDKRIAKCFGKCGRTYSGRKGLLRFYADVKGIPLFDAAKELRNLGIPVGISLDNPLEKLMEFWRDALFKQSSVSQRAITRLGVRGVDINSEILIEAPVGVFVPPPESLIKELPKEYRTKLKKIIDSIGNFATVHGYLDKNGEVKAIKFIPFDNEFRTLKDQIRVLAPEGMDNLYHGVPGVLQDYDEIYVVEGEFDFLTMATKTGLRNVVAFGGEVGKGSKSVFSEKTCIIVPDRFGDKRGEELAIDYISAIGGGEIYVVNWYSAEEEIEEDPAEMFRVDLNKYLSMIESLKVPAEVFIWDYVKQNVSSLTPSEVISQYSLIGHKIPTSLSVKVYELASEEVEDLNEAIFYRSTLPIDSSVTSDMVYDLLSKDFQVLLIHETPKEEVIYLRYKPMNSVRAVSITNKDRVFSALTNIVGRSFADYLIENLPLPESFFYKANGNLRKESEIVSELKNLTMLAIDRMKGEAAIQGAHSGERKILRRGVYWLDEQVAVIVSGKRVFIVKEGGKVEKSEDFVLFGGKYVIIPDEGPGADWLPKDVDFSRIKELDPKEVYQRTLNFIRTLIKFPETHTFQYSILALLPFYATIFDAFRDRVIWVVFNGDSGSAKTTLMRCLTSTQEGGDFHKIILNSDFIANYTPAGLRQFLDKDRLLVGLDEAEPEVLDRVMDEFRSMISADSKTVRGTKDQQAIEQENRFCAILTSIALPEKIQNLNRLLVFRFFRFDNVPTPIYTLRKNNMDYEFQKKLAEDIFLVSLPLFWKVKESRMKAEDILAEIAPNVSTRDAEAYSTILTVAEILGVDVREDMKRFIEEMSKVRKTQPTKEKIIHEIMNIQMTIEGKGTLVLSEICMSVEEDEVLREKLENRGIFVKDGWLHFPYVKNRYNLSFNDHTIAAYLADDPVVTVEDGIIKINLSRLKEKLVERKKNNASREIEYKGGTF